MAISRATAVEGWVLEVVPAWVGTPEWGTSSIWSRFDIPTSLSDAAAMGAELADYGLILGFRLVKKKVGENTQGTMECKRTLLDALAWRKQTVAGTAPN